MFDSSFGWRFINPKMQKMYGTDAMGVTAENLAEMYSISREDQDAFAVESHRRAAAAVDAIRRFGTSGVLGTIKLVNRSVQVVTDLGLDAALGEYDPEPIPIPLTGTANSPLHLVGDAALGLVNAAVGDHLHATESGLDLAMELRAGDRYVPLTTDALRAALPAATTKVALFVHGMATTEWSWSLKSETYHGDPAANFGQSALNSEM